MDKEELNSAFLLSLKGEASLFNSDWSNPWSSLSASVVPSCLVLWISLFFFLKHTWDSDRMQRLYNCENSVSNVVHARKYLVESSLSPPSLLLLSPPHPLLFFPWFPGSYFLALSISSLSSPPSFAEDQIWVSQNEYSGALQDHLSPLESLCILVLYVLN